MSRLSITELKSQITLQMQIAQHLLQTLRHTLPDDCEDKQVMKQTLQTSTQAVGEVRLSISLCTVSDAAGNLYVSFCTWLCMAAGVHGEYN